MFPTLPPNDFYIEITKRRLYQLMFSFPSILRTLYLTRDTETKRKQKKNINESERVNERKTLSHTHPSESASAKIDQMRRRLFAIVRLHSLTHRIGLLFHHSILIGFQCSWRQNNTSVLIKVYDKKKKKDYFEMKDKR